MKKELKREGLPVFAQIMGEPDCTPVKYRQLEK